MSACRKNISFVVKVLMIVQLFAADLYAQNLEKIGKKDMVTLSGSMSLNSIFYDAYGFTPRRDPLTWFFNGSMTVNILDVALPFTYSYSNRNSTYTQPFNMQSCSPKYKWVQAHIGTTSLNYSPYTLGGHMFTGAGIEFTPNGFFIGGMYGRFRKAVEYDFLTSNDNDVSFRRMGYAFKAGYDLNGHSLYASYFHAQDELNSLTFVPAVLNLSPMENTAIALTGKTKIWKCVNMEAEFAISGLTQNMESQEETTDFNGWEKWLIRTRSTTEFFRSWKVSVGYSGKIFSINAIHEHVDPGYQTLGAYFFNNDLENYTLAPSVRLWKGKLNLAVNTGFQRNNLAGDRLSTTQRWVGSVNVSCNPNKKWMITASYSNFSSYTRNRPQADPFWTPSPADTLSFYQLSQQGNGMISYMFGEKRIKNTIALVSSYQVTGQQQSGDVLPQTNIVNGNLTWSLQWVKSKFAVTMIGNFNQSENATTVTQQFGPGVQCSKSLMKNRVRFSAGGVYNRSYTNSVLLNNVMSYRAQASYTPKVKNPKFGRPSFSANAVYVNKLPVVTGLQSAAELTVTVNAVYGF